MSWYSVPRPPAPADGSVMRVGSVSIAMSTGLIALFVVFRSFVLMPVTIDGRRMDVVSKTTVEELVNEGVLPSRHGDLRGAVDGSVIETGGGIPPRYYRNGAEVRPSTRLFPGDVVASVSGQDVTESVVATNRPVPIPVVFKGRGPFVLLASPGAVGVAQAVVGQVSGQVVTQTVTLRPTPMVLQRVWPAKGARVVALTFDDGPWPRSTEEILWILRKEKVPATFFMLGRQVRKLPRVALDVARAGHQIGNHSDSHALLGRRPAAFVDADIGNAQKIITRTTHVVPTWFRPPGGSVNYAVYQQCNESKLRLVFWTVDPSDWRKPPSRFLVRRVVDNVQPGSVILLHDGGGDRSQTVNALPAIIRELRARGYGFVRLDQLGAAGR